MYYWRDVQIYDELRDVIPGAAVVKGQLLQRQDVVGFYLNAAAANQETTLVYRCRQTDADKKTGTGEAIISGDRLYHEVATGLVTPNRPAGTAGTDYYFIGWAKETVAASASQVLMNFDGTRYDETI